MTIEEIAHTEHQIDATIGELQRRHPERNGVEIERWTRAEFAIHAEISERELVPLFVVRAVEDRLRCTPPGIAGRLPPLTGRPGQAAEAADGDPEARPVGGSQT